MGQQNIDSIIINSVDRALEVLMVLHENPQGLGVSDLAHLMGMYKSTLFRTLATLEQRGFVQKYPDSTYRLGMTICALGIGVREQKRYLDELVNEAKKLCALWNENINISVLEDVDGVYKSVLVHREMNHSSVLRESTAIGSYTEGHLSSVGKCMLAFNSKVDLSYVKKLDYKKYTEYSITSPEVLWAELQKIRERGYAIDAEEREIGLYCIGVPIFSNTGEVIAAISVSGVAKRIKALDQDKLIESLKRVSLTKKLVV